MTRALLLSALFLVVACKENDTSPPPPAPTPPAASSHATPSALAGRIHGKEVALAGGGDGWLDAPTSPGKHPALIVIQEWWGMNDWIKQDVTRFAEKGYVALAVDLYRGKVAKDADEAHELMRGLTTERATADMHQGFDFLASRPDVDPKRIGIVGWCMGGGYALSFAADEPKIAAAAVNYGHLISDPAKIRGLHAALLGNFAGEDRGIEPKDVKAFAETLTKDHKDNDIKVYDGAKHAFMNPNNKDGYDPAAAQDAWKRIDEFFAKNLGG